MSNAKFPYLSAAEVADFPSIRNGLDPEKELSYRQQASAFIQELGQRLQCTQCTMNTAIVYMHRFYYLNSFTKFHRNTMAPACLFLACKVEEQPRKVEHIIKVVYRILYREKQPPEPNTEEYLQKAEELVVNENILLQTLGFRIIVDHPHPHIVRYCDRELANSGQVSHHIAQVAWFLATNSLHLTTFCLQYPPTIIAALCIYLSCKYISCPLQSKSNQPWWYDIDRNATEELLTKLAYEFVAIMDKAPTKYKTIKGSKIGSESLLGSSNSGATVANEDSSSAQGPADVEGGKSESIEKLVKEDAVEEKPREPEKSQRSVATTDDELASPPRKQSKLGTKISFKEYAARKVEQLHGPLLNQAGESPSMEHRFAAKSSPVVANSHSERPANSSTSKVPASLRDLPPLEPLTLSTNEAAETASKTADQSSVKLTKASNDQTKSDVARHAAARESVSQSNTAMKPEERHRTSNHHHHHHHHHQMKAGEDKSSTGSGSTHNSHDRHHRHHLHPHRSHSNHHNRHISGEKQNDASSAIKAERETHHHHRQHRPSEQGDSLTTGSNGKAEKSVNEPHIETGATLASKVSSLDGPDLSACQFLLATPPSPSSLQQPDLMDIVKTEASGDATTTAPSAECGQTVI